MFNLSETGRFWEFAKACSKPVLYCPNAIRALQLLVQVRKTRLSSIKALGSVGGQLAWQWYHKNIGKGVLL